MRWSAAHSRSDEPAAQLTLAGEDRPGQPGGVGVLVPLREGQAQLGQSEVDGGVLGVGHELIVVLADRSAATEVRERTNPRASTWRTRGFRCVSEGGLEPPCPIRALAPQASASANSATRTSGARTAMGRPSCDRERYTLGGPEPKSPRSPASAPVDRSGPASLGCGAHDHDHRRRRRSRHHRDQGGGARRCPARWSPGRRCRRRGSGRARSGASATPWMPSTTVDRLLADLVRVAGDVQVRSVGFCSIAETGSLVDAEGRAVSRLLAWHDPRGGRQAATLDPAVAAVLPSRTGLAVSSVATLLQAALVARRGRARPARPAVAGPARAGLPRAGRRAVRRALDAGPHRPVGHPRRGALRRRARGARRRARAGAATVAAGAALGRVRADHPVERVRGAVLTVAGHDHLVAAAALGRRWESAACATRWAPPRR